MSKKKKAMNREIYERTIGNYTYNSNYDPNKEMCADSIADKVDIYGTPYPNFDKNDYSKSMRGYKKNK